MKEDQPWRAALNVDTGICIECARQNLVSMCGSIFSKKFFDHLIELGDPVQKFRFLQLILTSQ